MPWTPQPLLPQLPATQPEHPAGQERKLRAKQRVPPRLPPGQGTLPSMNGPWSALQWCSYSLIFGPKVASCNENASSSPGILLQIIKDIVCIYVCIVIYICVCVDHLKRCKTPNYAGGGSRVQSLPPTKTLWFPWWYMAWSAMRTCISNFRQWRPAKPSTGMSFGFQFLLWIMLHLNLPQNFGVNRFQSTVRFSQSEFLSISSDGTVAFSKDKERILLHWFSCLVIQLSPVRF